MSYIKVLSVFGTRPEAIKMAPIIRELGKFPNRIISRVCITAQHREMLDQVLRLFDIHPDYDMDLMQASQTPTQVAAAVILELGSILDIEKPDWVLIQGDTTTTMAAGIAAFYEKVKIGHVEAGLRTNQKWQPFPEEINRKIVSDIADLHFTPTKQARQNLINEGIPDESIFVTGNPIIDSLLWIVNQSTTEISGGSDKHGWQNFIETLDNNKLILVTAHRRENFGTPLENICLALKDISERYRDCVKMVYPVHPNPNVQEPVYRLLGDVPNIILTQPLDYPPLIQLMKHSTLVLTDSGGIQEEAPGLGKPVLVLRNVTERSEAIQAGTARLVGTDRKRIVSETVRLLENPLEYKKMAEAVNPYGDGYASQRIVKALLGDTVSPFIPCNTFSEET